MPAGLTPASCVLRPTGRYGMGSGACGHVPSREPRASFQRRLDELCPPQGAGVLKPQHIP
eukprot:1179724-Prorocentrum_minimum.AAC.2